ncbi:MAG: hypothetical protein OQK82_07645, partial [Candidatus Pacearchaeota archaeon]|nr:hypothetical protein [Candidatus Pacearchaeota archaeon]
MTKKFVINITFSDKTFYTLIICSALIILGVGVYAFGNIPSPGHSISEIQTCDSDGQVLKMSEGEWVCEQATDTTLPSCSEGQVLKWDNGEWICGEDIDTDTNVLNSLERVDGGNGRTSNQHTVYCPSGKKTVGGGCNRYDGTGTTTYLQYSFG